MMQFANGAQPIQEVGRSTLHSWIRGQSARRPRRRVGEKRLGNSRERSESVSGAVQTVCGGIILWRPAGFADR